MDSLLLLQDFAVALVCAAIFGWVFRRLGLSSVVGFIVAGILIGPFTPPFSFISDKDRIQTLSQLGLVFLMFFVGLGLNLERLRRLGVVLFLTTMLGAVLIFLAAQAGTALLGGSTLQATVVAAMFMVSSSAILTRTLAENGLTHQKVGQRVLGITVLEDVIAIFMLTLLAARLQWQEAAQVGLVQTLWLLGGFVVFCVVLGLLLLPRLFKNLVLKAHVDLLTILVAGLLFLAAWLAAHMGYSVALGAFLFGLVVSETPVKDRIEKVFQGAHEMFSALFFVSVGMLLDVWASFRDWPLIALLAVVGLGLRFTAILAAQWLTGSSPRQGVQGASALLPIGEFSYIIAGMAVAASLFEASFFGAAVAVSILSAVISPLALRYSDPLGVWLESRQPQWLTVTRDLLGTWQERMGRSRKRNLIWKLLRPRIGQVVLEFLLLAGLLSIASSGYDGLRGFLEQASWQVPYLRTLYATVVTLVALGLGLMIWRNLSALSMIYAEAMIGTQEDRARLRIVFEGGLRAIVTISLAWLLWVFAPGPVDNPWLKASILALCALVCWLFWRRLVRWHSSVRVNLQATLETRDPTSRLGQGSSGHYRREEWAVELLEVEIADHARCIGKSLAELNLRKNHGAAIVEIERQGHVIQNPSAQDRLYAGDKVLLFGTEQQVDAARDFLNELVKNEESQHDFDNATLEIVEVPGAFSRLNQPLSQLRIPQLTGAQLLGIERDGQRLLNPSPEMCLRPGDRVLLLCTPGETAKFLEWLNRTDNTLITIR